MIVRDIAVDPLWKDFKDLALENGLHACWSTPVISSQGQLLATFALYYLMPNVPSDDDRKAVELLSRTAGIVIERHSSILERNKVKTELTNTESHLSALVSATSDVIYRVSADWTIMGTLDGRSNGTFDTENPILHWLLGGLNFQIEHHLFPRVSRIHYPAISSHIKQTCAEYGVIYNEYKSIFGAVASHLNHLYVLGRQRPVVV